MNTNKRLSHEVMQRASTLIDAGWTRKRVAAELGYSPTSLSKALKKWRNENIDAPEQPERPVLAFKDRNEMFLAARRYPGSLDAFLKEYQIGIRPRTFYDWAKPWAKYRREPNVFDRPRWHPIFEGRDEDFERFKQDWGVK